MTLRNKTQLFFRGINVFVTLRLVVLIVVEVITNAVRFYSAGGYLTSVWGPRAVLGIMAYIKNYGYIYISGPVFSRFELSLLKPLAWGLYFIGLPFWYLAIGIGLLTAVIFVAALFDDFVKGFPDNIKKWEQEYKTIYFVGLLVIGILSCLVSLAPCFALVTTLFPGLIPLVQSLELVPGTLKTRPWTVLTSLFVHNSVLSFFITVIQLRSLRDMYLRVQDSRFVTAFLVMGGLTNLLRCMLYGAPFFSGSVILSGAWCALYGLMAIEIMCFNTNITIDTMSERHAEKTGIKYPRTGQRWSNGRETQDWHVRLGPCSLGYALLCDLLVMGISWRQGTFHKISHLAMTLPTIVAVIWVHFERRIGWIPKIITINDGYAPSPASKLHSKNPEKLKTSTHNATPLNSSEGHPERVDTSGADSDHGDFSDTDSQDSDQFHDCREP